MAYSRNYQSRKFQIPIDNLGMPVPAFIGKKGAVIKRLQALCGCKINVNNKNNCVEIFADNKKLVDTKKIISAMIRNWNDTGRIDLPEPIKSKSRPKVTISTDSSGWTTRSSTSQKLSIEEEKISSINTCYRGQYADLDESSDDEVDIDDEREIANAVCDSMQGRIGLEAVEAFAKKLPKTRSYEEIHKDIESAQNFLASLGNSWADAADREDTEAELVMLKEELEKVDKIQLLIQEHPDM